MTAQNFELINLVFCDDIRTEVSGKQILVGVYTDAIIFPHFPAMLPQLCLYICIRPQIRNPKKLTIKLINKDGKEVFNSDQELSIENAHEDPMVTNIVMPNVKVEGPNTYTVLFGVDDELVKIGQVSVRLPSPGKEQERIQKLT